MTSCDLQKETLFCAIQRKDLSATEKCLKHICCASLNTVYSQSGYTALQMAAIVGFHQAIEALVVAGADPLIPGTSLIDISEEPTALHLAVVSGHLKTVRELLFYTPVDIEDGNGDTPLILAIKNNYVAIFRYLLKRNANVNYTAHQNWPPLWRAIEKRSDICVRLLLKNGADVNYTDIDQDQALNMAAMFGTITASRMLLNYGAEIENKCCNGNTALHNAMFACDFDACSVLLDHGASMRNLCPWEWPKDWYTRQSLDLRVDHLNTPDVVKQLMALFKKTCLRRAIKQRVQLAAATASLTRLPVLLKVAIADELCEKNSLTFGERWQIVEQCNKP